ncbi:MAG UNVERIFIED_CONTAM: cell division protein ZapA [Rickettsiaceae bacterium]|jgi:cell division protein ZapA
MSIITITINNKKFQIGCNDGQENLVQNAAIKLSERIEMLKRVNPGASNELLLIMCALGLEDDNSSLREKLGNVDLDDDKKLSETLSTIAGYLEDLANKIAK